MRAEEPAGLLFVAIMCLSLFLAMVGGVGTLAVLIDSRHSRAAPQLGFACLAALGGAVFVAFFSTFVAARLSVPSDLRIYAFAAGYVLGGGAGLVSGRRLAGFYERAIRPGRSQRPSLTEQLR